MGDRYPIRAKAFVEVELEKDDLARALVEEALKTLGEKPFGHSNIFRDYYVSGDDGISIYKRAHNYGRYDDPDTLIGKSEVAASLLLAAYALSGETSFSHQWKHVTQKSLETEETK